jgi:pilus assembly protein CpaE
MSNVGRRPASGPGMPIIDARQYKTLLICPAKAMGTELTPLLAQALPLAPIHDVNVYPNRRQLVDLLRAFDPALCFLDFSTSKADAFQFVQDLHALLPGLPIVAVLASNDPDLVLQCIRQGAADFLIRPFTNDQLDSAVEKLARLLPAAKMSAGGKVITVVPAKGASGSTTVACNLAFQSKRIGAKRVLLADMDPLTGTVSFVLKVKSSYSFMDVLTRETALDSDLWKQMISPSNGIEVLLPPETFVDPIADLQSASSIVEYARSVYDVVILDCGSPFGNWNLSMARDCDELLLVATPDLPSLHAAQRVLTYFEQSRIDTSKLKIVINRVTKDVGLNSANIAKSLECEIFQSIPADPDAIQKSLMEGKPIPANTAVGRTFARLADALVNVKETGTRKASAKSGLFSSIFSR